MYSSGNWISFIPILSCTDPFHYTFTVTCTKLHQLYMISTKANNRNSNRNIVGNSAFYLEWAVRWRIWVNLLYSCQSQFLCACHSVRISVLCHSVRISLCCVILIVSRISTCWVIVSESHCAVSYCQNLTMLSVILVFNDMYILHFN